MSVSLSILLLCPGHILPGMLYTKKMNKGLMLIVVLAAIGVGALNEVFEFMMVVILPNIGVGDYTNNAIDLVANSLCAILGVRLSHDYSNKMEK